MKTNKAEITYMDTGNSLVPDVDPLYVKFGFANQLETIIESGKFLPVFITGLSGNGKTMMVEQISAILDRELIRVNFISSTDEDDLMGGFRLQNGETVYEKGPVLKAMERGAILLLDEVDAGDPNKLMCLHGPLEGKGYFVKKTGEFVKPAPGFNVIVTANTKGKGSDDGRFIGTNILNEAFLERFAITVEQEYPDTWTETKIMEKVFDDLGITSENSFIKSLVNWADTVRNSFNNDVVDEIISTRRLVHLANTFAIFGDRLEAVKLATNRFDDDIKETFVELYEKIDAELNPPPPVVQTPDYPPLVPDDPDPFGVASDKINKKIDDKDMSAF